MLRAGKSSRILNLSQLARRSIQQQYTYPSGIFRFYHGAKLIDARGKPYKKAVQQICQPWNIFKFFGGQIGRNFSDIGRGTDLLADSLAFGDRRKIILDAYYPTGFDVAGMLVTPSESAMLDGHDEEERSKSDTLHMNGSIIAFPHSCFLWDVKEPKDVTLESLSPVVLHKPAVEYLFIGSNKPLPPRKLKKIKKDLKLRGIIVEQLDVTNAMGTFNILNGEDRRVAVALIMDPDLGGV